MSSLNSSSGTVHGVVVGQISPVKTSVNTKMSCFNGSFTDGRKMLHMVSFDPKLHDKFEEVQKSHSPVVVKNCVVNRGRTGELEIMLNAKSCLVFSPKNSK